MKQWIFVCSAFSPTQKKLVCFARCQQIYICFGIVIQLQAVPDQWIWINKIHLMWVNHQQKEWLQFTTELVNTLKFQFTWCCLESGSDQIEWVADELTARAADNTTCEKNNSGWLCVRTLPAHVFAFQSLKWQQNKKVNNRDLIFLSSKYTSMWHQHRRHKF